MTHLFLFHSSAASCAYRVDPEAIAALKARERGKHLRTLYGQMQAFGGHLPESLREPYRTWSMTVYDHALSGVGK